MGNYEKKLILEDYAKEHERKLGEYLWLEGADKSDSYAQYLIGEIRATKRGIVALVNQALGAEMPEVDAGNQNSNTVILGNEEITELRCSGGKD